MVEQKLTILRNAFGPDGSVRAACDQYEVGSGGGLHVAPKGHVCRTDWYPLTASPTFYKIEVAAMMLCAV